MIIAVKQRYRVRMRNVQMVKKTMAGCSVVCRTIVVINTERAKKAASTR